jgi:excisionase family DNA binding protein
MATAKTLQQTRHLPPDLAPFLSVKEAAKQLGVHRTTVTELIENKQLSAILFGRRWLVTKDGLEALRLSGYTGKPGRRRRLL